MEVKAMRPTPAAQENLAHLLRGKLSDRIEDAHRLNNGGQVENPFKRKIKRNDIKKIVFS